MSHRVSVLLAALVVLAVSGCEKGPPPGAPLGDPSPVHGKVTLPSGSAIRGGVISFYPVEAEVGRKIRFEGAALIDAKGDYTAGRNGDGKGLVPGEYIVTVGPRELGELPGSTSSSVPKIYTEKKTSTYRVTVEESDNTLNIALK